MDFVKCQECGREYLFSRVRCSSCGSMDLKKGEIFSARILERIHLIATPDTFPDEYDVAFVRTENGMNVFCRLENTLEPGTIVTLQRNASGITCVGT